MPDAQAGAVRTRGGEVEWHCAACGEWTALAAPACGVCGTARSGFGGPTPARRARPEVAPALVLAATVVLPGAGHLLLGRVGTGAARLLLALLWGGGALAMARDAAATRGPALVLAAGVLALWIGSLLDVRTELTGTGREVLSARTLLWLVVGVTVALVATLLLAATTGVG